MKPESIEKSAANAVLCLVLVMSAVALWMRGDFLSTNIGWMRDKASAILGKNQDGILMQVLHLNASPKASGKPDEVFMMAIALKLICVRAGLDPKTTIPGTLNPESAAKVHKLCARPAPSSVTPGGMPAEGPLIANQPPPVRGTPT